MRRKKDGDDAGDQRLGALSAAKRRIYGSRDAVKEERKRMEMQGVDGDGNEMGRK
jgi:hypothetical protein